MNNTKVLINTYRGWNIYFNTDTEQFGCHSDDFDREQNGKRSYASCKAFIDEFLKDNSDFKPFYVEANPNGYKSRETLKIIGIRKDGVFFADDGKGGKKTVSSYNNDEYMLVDQENEKFWAELEEIGNEYDRLLKRKSEIKAKFKVVSLKEVKNRYIPK